MGPRAGAARPPAAERENPGVNRGGQRRVWAVFAKNAPRGGWRPGQEVVARGWYRRLPGPAVELREVQAADGRRARTWSWVTRYLASGLLLVAGLLVMLAGVSGT